MAAETHEIAGLFSFSFFFILALFELSEEEAMVFLVQISPKRLYVKLMFIRRGVFSFAAVSFTLAAFSSRSPIISHSKKGRRRSPETTFFVTGSFFSFSFYLS